MKTITKEQILKILSEFISAEERNFLGDPMSPLITGKEEASEEILKLIQNKLVEPVKIQKESK